MDDWTPIRLKPEDSAPAAEIVAPRRVRSLLVAIDGRVLDHQDTVEALFDHVQGQEGRTLLRRLYGALETTHERVQGAIESVVKGG